MANTDIVVSPEMYDESGHDRPSFSNLPDALLVDRVSKTLVKILAGSGDPEIGTEPHYAERVLRAGLSLLLSDFDPTGPVGKDCDIIDEFYMRFGNVVANAKGNQDG